MASSESLGPSEKLKAHRCRLGISEFRVAMRLGIPLHTYWDLEEDDRNFYTGVSLENLLSLGMLLDIHPNSLLGHEPRASTQQADRIRELCIDDDVLHTSLSDLIDTCDTLDLKWPDVLAVLHARHVRRSRAKLFKRVACGLIALGLFFTVLFALAGI